MAKVGDVFRNRQLRGAYMRFDGSRWQVMPDDWQPPASAVAAPKVKQALPLSTLFPMRSLNNPTSMTVSAAKKAGLSYAQIVMSLSQNPAMRQKVAAARRNGYGESDIVGYLASGATDNGNHRNKLPEQPIDAPPPPAPGRPADVLARTRPIGTAQNNAKAPSAATQIRSKQKQSMMQGVVQPFVDARAAAQEPVHRYVKHVKGKDYLGQAADFARIPADIIVQGISGITAPVDAVGHLGADILAKHNIHSTQFVQIIPAKDGRPESYLTAYPPVLTGLFEKPWALPEGRKIVAKGTDPKTGIQYGYMVGADPAGTQAQDRGAGRALANLATMLPFPEVGVGKIAGLANEARGAVGLTHDAGAVGATSATLAGAHVAGPVTRASALGAKAAPDVLGSLPRIGTDLGVVPAKRAPRRVGDAKPLDAFTKPLNALSPVWDRLGRMETGAGKLRSARLEASTFPNLPKPGRISPSRSPFGSGAGKSAKAGFGTAGSGKKIDLFVRPLNALSAGRETARVTVPVIESVGAKVPEAYTVFYHGTTAESASLIRAHGIDISKSSGFADFGQGFYLTTDREEALLSGARNATQGVPLDVVEFRVPNSELGRLDTLNFPSAGSDWQDFVAYNRRIKGYYQPPAEWMPLPDMVTGPMYRTVDRQGLPIEWPARGPQTSIHTPRAVGLFDKYMVRP